MDPLPSVSQPSRSSSSQSNAVEAPGEAGEDPYSPGPQPAPYIVGVLIAGLTVTVPLLTVLMGRSGDMAPVISESTPSQAIPAAWASDQFSADAGAKSPRNQGPGRSGPDRQNQPHSPAP